MARTLDATLLAAQDNISRRPIVEILSQQATAEIPFDGQRLGSIDIANDLGEFSIPQVNTNIVYHSTGSIISLTSERNKNYVDYTFYYSDAARTTWTGVTVDNADIYASYTSPRGRSTIIERTSDNNLIAAMPIGTGDDYRDSYAVIFSPTGTVLNTVKVFDDPGDPRFSTPAIAKIGSSYWMLVFYLNSTDEKMDVVYKTSSDGETWDATATELTLPGFDDTKIASNPNLFVAASGKVILTFDYEVSRTDNNSVKHDIFWTESTDNGVTWSTITNITDDDTPGVDRYESRIIEYSTGNIALTYSKQTAALVKKGLTPPTDEPSYMLYDNANRALYVIHSYVHVGDKSVESIEKINVDTWQTEEVWHATSTPSFSDSFIAPNADHWWPRIAHLEIPYIVIESYNNIAVFNTETETITEYYWYDSATFNFDQNIFPHPSGYDGNIYTYYDAGILSYTVDAVNHKLWIAWGEMATLGDWLSIGYIDLTEVADGLGNYTYHEVVSADLDELVPSSWSNEKQTQSFSNSVNSLFIPGDGRIYFQTRTHNVYYDNVGYYGPLYIFSESSGGSIDVHYHGVNSGLPKNGAHDSFFYDGKIYGGVYYTDVENQEDRSGIFVFDVYQKTTRYINIPTGEAFYGLRYDGDNGLMLTCVNSFCVMDLTSETWTVYDEETVPNLPISAYFGDQTYLAVTVPTYNPTDRVYYVANNHLDLGPFIAAIPKEGNFEQGMYMSGVLQGDDSYIFQPETNLLLGFQENGVDAAIDENNGIWAVWGHEDVVHDIHYAMWDNDAGIFEMTDYLVAGKPVKAKWSIADPSKLSFSASHGHLFDQSNRTSILSKHLKKGCKITLRFGEYVDGEFWENQGTFFVTENKLTYQREAYPVIDVSAEDRLSGWKEGTIRATQHFAEVPPETVVETLITTYGESYLTSEDYNIPTFTNSHNLFHQFIDRTLWEMLEILGDHFGFIPYVDMDGKINFREIDLTAATAHTYSDATQLINYTPNDAFATLINRITVIGETRSFTEVTYAYERMGNLSGTTGWWGDNKDKKVWYSTDGSLEAVNPFLEVNESTDEFEIFIIKGGGGEYISDTDLNNRWVEVTIDAPNLVGLFVGTLAAFIATAATAITCTATCGPFIFATSTLSSVLINILGAVAHYDIDVYAQPMGRERRSVQGTAEDLMFQTEIGRVVEEFIDDPMCYNQDSCETVAEREIMIASAQRRQISFEKVAHLQDEIGDIIKIVHPHSLEPVELMITELERVLLRPQPGGGQGVFKDKIEGWRIV